MKTLASLVAILLVVAPLTGCVGAETDDDMSYKEPVVVACVRRIVNAGANRTVAPEPVSGASRTDMVLIESESPSKYPPPGVSASRRRM